MQSSGGAEAGRVRRVGPPHRWSALPFWLLGFFQGAVTQGWFRRHQKLGAGLLASAFLAVVAANALLQHSYLSNAWTHPIINALWFLLAIPAGLHFWSLSRDKFII